MRHKNHHCPAGDPGFCTSCRTSEVILTISSDDVVLIICSVILSILSVLALHITIKLQFK
jgi:hypothetical protein